LERVFHGIKAVKDFSFLRAVLNLFGKYYMQLLGLLAISCKKSNFAEEFQETS